MKTTHLVYLMVSLLVVACQKTEKLEGTVLIENINIVDVVNASIIPNQNVLLNDNQIIYIGEANGTQNFKVDTSVKAAGNYLIPGLWDMHAHPDDPEVWRMNPNTREKDRLLPLFVVNGVTGIRDMAGDLNLIKRWRKMAESDSLLAPKIFAGGPLLDGPNPMWDGSVGINSPDQVKMVVDSLIDEGVDFLKVYSLLPRETYLALSKYANEIDYPFVGHVPFTVPPSEAALTGMKSQEHLLEILKECADQPSEAYLAEIGRMEDRIERSNKINDFRLRTFNETKADSLYNLFKANDIWHCPTLSMWYKNAWYESEYPKDEELVALLPPYLRAYWTPEHNDHLQYRNNQDFIEIKQRLYRLYQQMVHKMNQKGIKLLAGTDMGANPLCHPGVGLHNELQAFVDAGLTPAEALRTATLNPALFFEIENEYGTVEVGKIADLVILEGNPLENIQKVGQISSVIKDGRVITKNEIAEIKDNILRLNAEK